MTAPVSPRPTRPVAALVSRQRAQLAAELEALRVAQLAAGASNPALLEQAHAFCDADADTAWPLPGIAHPNTDAEVTA